MTGKTHAGVGIVAFVAFYDKIPGGFSYLGIVVALIASLLPDIDHPKSMVNKYILPFKNKTTKITIYVCLGICVLWFDHLYVNEPLMKALGYACIAIGISSHREGLMHSLSGMILFSIISGYIGNKYSSPHIIYYFMIGYGMHLVCDMANNRGVPLFYPFRNKKVKWPLTYRVGSKVGTFIESTLIILGFIYVLYKIPFI